MLAPSFVVTPTPSRLTTRSSEQAGRAGLVPNSTLVFALPVAELGGVRRLYPLMKRHILFLALLFGPSFANAQSTDLPTFSFAPGQVFEVSVVLNADGRSDLLVYLVSEKRAEFAGFTQRYLRRQVQIVVYGKTLLQPIIRDQILSGSVDIPCSSPESALVLAKTLMAK